MDANSHSLAPVGQVKFTVLMILVLAYRLVLSPASQEGCRLTFYLPIWGEGPVCLTTEWKFSRLSPTLIGEGGGQYWLAGLRKAPLLEEGLSGVGRKLRERVEQADLLKGAFKAVGKEHVVRVLPWQRGQRW